MAYCKAVQEAERVIRESRLKDITNLRACAKHIAVLSKLESHLRSHKGTFPHVELCVSTNWWSTICLTVSIRHIKAIDYVLEQLDKLSGKVAFKPNTDRFTVVDHGKDIIYTMLDSKGKFISQVKFMFRLVSDGTSKCRVIVQEKIANEPTYFYKYRIECDDNGDNDETTP